MSEMRTLTLIATFVLLARSDLPGQASSERTDSLLREVLVRDSTLVLRARVVDSLRRAVARPVPPVDVVHGPLRVRTLAELEARVSDAVDSLAKLVERRGGSVIPSRVGRRVASVARDSQPAMFGHDHFIAITPDTARRSWTTAGRHRIPLRASSGAIMSVLTSMVEQVAFEGADSTLSAWVMVGRLPLAPASGREASDAHVDLATTESLALRRCRAGDDLACLDALGIDSVPGSRLSRWYAPSDYHSLLRTVAPPREDSAAIVAWLRCRNERDDTACRTAAQAVPDDRLPPPLSATARFMVLREVLDAGGTGAYDRLLSVSGSLRTRLAAASGEPVEKTVRRWLARVERSRPQEMPVSAGLVAASVGWAGALLALTLTRRSPWT